MLQDTQGRTIGYLRLSLTKACSMKCIYCRPTQLGLPPKGAVMLSAGEIETLVRHLVDQHGLSKVRLTGGDPTSRPDLVKILNKISSINGIQDLAMTTNGLTLASHARQYADNGLKRLNVSMDTLNRERFAYLTGVDGLPRVLKGIDTARSAGLWPIKINSVVIKGQNDKDTIDLVRYGADNKMPVRFIELMPMGPLADQWEKRYVCEADMKAHLEPHIQSWQPLEQGHDAARKYKVQLKDGRQTTIGFITPMSCNFCAACNRIRIAADGGYYPCLMDEPRGTILPAMRPKFDSKKLDHILGIGLKEKRTEHPHDGFVVMTHIGG